MLVSFAHAFLLLLVPKEVYSFDEPPPTDGDPNNPWHLTSSYYQIQNDGTLSSKPSLVQKPDMNTNMFTNYKTSLLSMYLYLTGNDSFFFI